LQKISERGGEVVGKKRGRIKIIWSLIEISKRFGRKFHKTFDRLKSLDNSQKINERERRGVKLKIKCPFWRSSPDYFVQVRRFYGATRRERRVRKRKGVCGA
jgi:hypothetical protein